MFFRKKTAAARSLSVKLTDASGRHATMEILRDGERVPVYEDAGLTIERPLPIVADTAGIFPVCYVKDQ